MTKKQEPLWPRENGFYKGLFDSTTANSLKLQWEQSSGMPQMDKDFYRSF